MKNFVSLTLAACIVSTAFSTVTASYDSPEYERNFDSYFCAPGGKAVPDSTVAVTGGDKANSNSSLPPDYDYYSVITGRGRGLEVYAKDTNKQTKVDLTNKLIPNPSYSFNVSIMRKDFLSDITITLANGNNAFTSIVSLKKDKKVYTKNTAVANFSCNANEWIDLQITLNPTNKKLNLYVFQGDNYGEILNYDYSKEANLCNNTTITKMRIYSDAGTYNPSSAFVLDDIMMYSCADTSTGEFMLAAANPAFGRKWLPTNTKMSLVFTEPVDVSDSEWILQRISNGTPKDIPIESNRVNVDTDNNKRVEIDLEGLIDIGDNVIVKWSGLLGESGTSNNGNTEFYVSDTKFVAAEVSTEVEEENCSFNIGGICYDSSMHALAMASLFDAEGSPMTKDLYDITFSDKFQTEEKNIVLSDASDTAELYYLDNLYNMNDVVSPMLITGNTFTADSYTGNKEIESKVDYEIGKITISGKTNTDNGYLSIAVLNPGVSVDDYKTAETEEPGSGIEMINYMRSILYTDGFNLCYDPRLTNGGKMSVLINYHDGNGTKEYENQITYLTNNDIADALEAFNADEANYTELVDLWGSMLDLDNIAYNALGTTEEEKNAAQNAVNMYLKGARPYDSIANIQKEYAEALFLQQINYAKNGKVVVDFIESNYDLLEIQDEIFELYNDNKEKIYSDVSLQMERKYDSINQLSEAFCNAVVASLIKTSTSYIDVMTTLKKCRQYLETLETNGWSFNKFDTLSDPKDVFLALVGCENDDIKSVFDAAVNKRAEEEERTANFGDTPFGGGSQNSPKVSVSLPQTTLGNTAQTTNPFFNDLKNVLWAEDAINALAYKGILSGKGNGIFEPEANMLREEAAKMILLAFSGSPKSALVLFDDVQFDKWYAPYIASAVESGIVSGISDKLFGIGLNITRQDFALMCTRATGMDVNSNFDPSIDNFTDYNEISDYAKSAVLALKHMNILNGRDNGMFCPKDNITRAEAAKIVYEMMKMNGGNN